MVARPLVLKSQVGRSGKSVAATTLPIAQVWVDTGVYHLDSPFDYLIPELYSSVAQIGVRVEVPFGSTLREGIIANRIADSDSVGKVKEISRILSPHPIATVESLELIEHVANRWSANRYDVVRSAIPPRVHGVDRSFVPGAKTRKIIESSKANGIPEILAQRRIRAFWSMPPNNKFDQLLSELIRIRGRHGQVLVVVPDEATLESLYLEVSRSLPEMTCARVDAKLPRSERYLNFLKCINQQVEIIFGMRGAIFTPLASDSTIIIIGESSHHLYEIRSPGWNARDVALLRAHMRGINLVLVGYSPSLETARMIDEGFLTLVSSKGRRNILAIDSAYGELLPSRLFPVIRKALKRGPVLFLVPSKGYGNAILCGKCRNLALCSCGGKLQRKKANEVPECAICMSRYPDWRCSWCQSDKIYIASRGIDRFAEEIGHSFPNIPLINSSGDRIVRLISSDPALVIATPSAAPRTDQGYSAVVLLQVMRFFGHSDLRSHERARDMFFNTVSFGSPDGDVCLVVDPSYPIVAALSRWDPTVMSRRELLELADAHLPPYWRVVIVEVNSLEGVSLVNGLRKANAEKRLPAETSIIGPFEKESGISRITLSSPSIHAQELIDFIHELQRRRSISHKPLYSISVDPYSLA